MATTTYTVSVQNVEGEFETVATKSKKATAIALAQSVRADRKATTQVHTNNGTLVAEIKARKPQKKTKPYTRVAPLPEGFEAPEGKRVAYTRIRKGCAILHDFDEQYWVFDYTQGAILATFGTTRQCGRYLADAVSLSDDGKVLVSE